MISSLYYKFDTTQNMVAKVSEKREAPTCGNALKLFIPALMQSLNMTVPPSKHKTSCATTTSFVNGNGCMPSLKAYLDGQNYITATMENNASWENVAKFGYRFRDLSSRVTGRETYAGSSLILTEKYKAYYTEGGEKVECHIRNGKLSKMTFTTNR